MTNGWERKRGMAAAAGVKRPAMAVNRYPTSTFAQTRPYAHTCLRSAICASRPACAVRNWGRQE